MAYSQTLLVEERAPLSVAVVLQSLSSATQRPHGSERPRVQDFCDRIFPSQDEGASTECRETEAASIFIFQVLISIFRFATSSSCWSLSSQVLLSFASLEVVVFVSATDASSV